MKRTMCVQMPNYLRDVLIAFMGMLIVEFFSVLPFAHSENALPGKHASNCVYVADIESKHESISSIQEDITYIEKNMSKKVRAIVEGCDPSNVSEKVNLEITARDLMSMTPPVVKLAVMPQQPMAGTLKPETKLEVIREEVKEGK